MNAFALPKAIKTQFGECWVRSVQVQAPFVSNSMVQIELESNDIKIAQLFTGHMDNPFNGIQMVDQEFICIWCGSVNPITNRHCSQCGGTRGFIIK